MTEITQAQRNKSKQNKQMSAAMKKRGVKFPNCIGTFPECRDFFEGMKDEDRKECKFCPHVEKKIQ